MVRNLNIQLKHSTSMFRNANTSHSKWRQTCSRYWFNFALWVELGCVTTWNLILQVFTGLLEKIERHELVVVVVVARSRVPFVISGAETSLANLFCLFRSLKSTTLTLRKVLLLDYSNCRTSGKNAIRKTALKDIPKRV
jgi:hypothetical protein